MLLKASLVVFENYWRCDLLIAAVCPEEREPGVRFDAAYCAVRYDDGCTGFDRKSFPVDEHPPGAFEKMVNG